MRDWEREAELWEQAIQERDEARRVAGELLGRWAQAQPVLLKELISPCPTFASIVKKWQERYPWLDPEAGA
jgi:hypothetical protein